MNEKILDLRAFVDELIRRRVPYRISGRDLATGLDCEGFVRLLFQRLGIELDRDIFKAREDFVTVKRPPEALDLILFRDHLIAARHLGLMLDRRHFAHCSYATNGVAKSDLYSPFFSRVHLSTARHKSL